jgi:hypothetical protein
MFEINEFAEKLNEEVARTLAIPPEIMGVIENQEKNTLSAVQYLSGVYRI